MSEVPLYGFRDPDPNLGSGFWVLRDGTSLGGVPREQRCSRDTYPEPYITECTQFTKIISVGCDLAWPLRKLFEEE